MTLEEIKQKIKTLPSKERFELSIFIDDIQQDDDMFVLFSFLDKIKEAYPRVIIKHYAQVKHYDFREWENKTIFYNISKKQLKKIRYLYFEIEGLLYTDVYFSLGNNKEEEFKPIKIWK